MRDVVILFFWCWCATSIVVLLRRIVTKSPLRSRPRGAVEVDAEESFEARLLRGPHTVTPVEPDPSDVAQGALEPQPLSARVTTIAEALKGIALPNGLMPVTSDQTDLRNILFSTSGHYPAAIKADLSAELGRLGFSVQPEDDETIHAVKEDAELQIRIHRDLERARMRLGANLATLPESSIIVQIRLR